jgi:hypothetical protein
MELTKDEQGKIICFIKNHIREKGNCRVGVALKEIVGKEYENSIHNIEKIANTIIESGKYVKEPSLQKPGDLNIYKNPQYKLTKFNIWTVIINILIALLSFAAMIYTFLSTKQ